MSFILYFIILYFIIVTKNLLEIQHIVRYFLPEQPQQRGTRNKKLVWALQLTNLLTLKADREITCLFAERT